MDTSAFTGVSAWLLAAELRFCADLTREAWPLRFVVEPGFNIYETTIKSRLEFTALGEPSIIVRNSFSGPGHSHPFLFH